MMATIGNLQEELLLKIFSHYIQSEGHEIFLRNVPRVCKAWNVLSTEAPLWKDVTLRDPNYAMNFSRRGLLRHTHTLKFAIYGESFYETNLSALLKNIEDLKALDLGYMDVGDVIKLITEHCPHLERLNLGIPERTTFHDLEQFLTICGPTLKHLDLHFYWSQEAGRQLVSEIASKCPLLETLVFMPKNEVTPFPIHNLRSGCPRLRELLIHSCQLINAERKDSSLDCGFRELKKFKVFYTDFNGEDVSRLLKDSMDLERLTLYNNDNVVFRNISKIPTDKVRILDIKLKDPNEKLKALEDAVYKWRRTLSTIKFRYDERDVSSIFERFLQDNPNPRLNCLAIAENINPHFFQKFIKKCQNLIRLKIGWEEYKGREEIEEALELLVKERENCA